MIVQSPWLANLNPRTNGFPSSREAGLLFPRRIYDGDRARIVAPHGMLDDNEAIACWPALGKFRPSDLARLFRTTAFLRDSVAAG